MCHVYYHIQEDIKSLKDLIYVYMQKNKPLSYLNAYKKILNSKIRKKLIANAINYNKKYSKQESSYRKYYQSL